jgi:pSer/pThr/pTyr-binding forkhead associated (FHA) protein
MPVISVKFKGKKIEEHSLVRGLGCNIGRKKENDIVIDNLAVSGFHAQIDSVSNTFVLRDLESTNGTFVNDEKITMHNLKHNDSILIGKHKLIFDCSDIMSMHPNEADNNDEKTRFLNANDLRELAGWTKKDSAYDWYEKSNLPDTGKQKNASFISRVFQRIFG